MYEKYQDLPERVYFMFKSPFLLTASLDTNSEPIDSNNIDNANTNTKLSSPSKIIRTNHVSNISNTNGPNERKIPRPMRKSVLHVQKSYLKTVSLDTNSEPKESNNIDNANTKLSSPSKIIRTNHILNASNTNGPNEQKVPRPMQKSVIHVQKS